jgi:hypothetical protein
VCWQCKIEILTKNKQRRRTNRNRIKTMMPPMKSYWMCWKPSIKIKLQSAPIRPKVSLGRLGV